MPMPLDEKKRGAIVSIVMKKLKGSNDFDNLKYDPEKMKEKKMEDGAEVDYAESGYESAVNEMMSSLESKNVKNFQSALKSFIQMCMNEYE